MNYDFTQNYHSGSVYMAHKNLLLKFLVKGFSIFTQFFLHHATVILGSLQFVLEVPRAIYLLSSFFFNNSKFILYNYFILQKFFLEVFSLQFEISLLCWGISELLVFHQMLLLSLYVRCYLFLLKNEKDVFVILLNCFLEFQYIFIFYQAPQ